MLPSSKNSVTKLEMHIIQIPLKYWIISKIHPLIDVEEMPHVDLLYLEQRFGTSSKRHIRKWHESITILKAGIADFNLCVPHGILRPCNVFIL